MEMPGEVHYVPELALFALKSGFNPLYITASPVGEGCNAK